MGEGRVGYCEGKVLRRSSWVDGRERKGDSVGVGGGFGGCWREGLVWGRGKYGGRGWVW